ncbi:MAG: VCBS repeat-containing protein [Phycisphaerales bacterium]|nr:VCBS repeat-containing protein [Phycisphaerales bacterium]
MAIGADQAEWFSSGETEVLLVSNEDGALLTFVDAHVIARADECAVTIADLNTDGRLEILLARYPGWEAGIIPLLNEGAWAFTELDAIRTDEFGPAFSSSDLNGDGQIDLIHAGERALATAMNITSLPGPFFDHTPLRRGEPAEFVVIGGVPGETAHFLYSLGAPEPSRGVRTLGGITLDLADPITRFGAATVQPDGRAALRRTIPANAPLRTVTTQAVIRRGPGGADSVKTPFRTARIGP